MREWQIHQEIYHRLHQEHSDDLNQVDIVMTDDIVGDAVRHFRERVDEWIYPAKSYFVAICYAHWISGDFGDDFYETLNNPMLLYGNDPYFKIYGGAKDVYDQILAQIDRPIAFTGMVPDVREYYDAEIGHKFSQVRPNAESVM